MNESINLLDPHKQSESRLSLKRVNKMRAIAILLLFLVSMASVILFILVAVSPLPELQRKEQSLRITLAESKNELAQHAIINERTEVITKILASRGSLHKSINLIQSNLPKDVAVAAINADRDVVAVTLESASLNSLDTFIQSMRQLVEQEEGFSQITMSNLLTDNTKNTYTVTLSLSVKKL